MKDEFVKPSKSELKVRLEAPELCGAFPAGFYSLFTPAEAGERELTVAQSVKDKLRTVDFGFNERPWLVAAGSCHFPIEVAQQIENRAAILPEFLAITEEILNDKFDGNPAELLGLPSRDEQHGATIARFDDILMPDGKLLATEIEGWSSGQGQIIATSQACRLEVGKEGLSSPFSGIDLAAVASLGNSFGKEANVVILIPDIPDESGWKYTVKDFELFATYCRVVGFNLTVERPAEIKVEGGKVKGKAGVYDVLYPFFPPSGYVDEKVTAGKGKQLLKVWADGNVELFPEPSWLQSKLTATAIFDPENKTAYLSKLSSCHPDWTLEDIEVRYREFKDDIFPWSWPLDPDKPPILDTGQQLDWEEFLAPEFLSLGWVFRPLLGTECAGLIFSGEMDPASMADFAKKKLGQFIQGEPYPLKPGSGSRIDREGWTFENDYRSYFVQKQIPHQTFKARYLNPEGTGIRKREGFNARICTTVFIDGQGKAEIGDVDVTLRKDSRVHGAKNSIVTMATFDNL